MAGINKPPQGDPDRSNEQVHTPPELYALVVEMADRVSQRRQSANSFYLSVNAALIGASAYLSTGGTSGNIWLLGVSGAAMSCLWAWNIQSYKTLNSAKFRVIHDLEKTMSYKPYTDEWSLLDPDGDGKRHTPFHKVERLVPWVFCGVHITQSAASFPYWKSITSLGCMALHAVH